MYYYNRILFMYFVLSIYGKRDLFEKQCKRECNTEYGTLDCWKRTTNGFSYGLSTAMIDYCQLILQLHQNNNESLYNISQNILIKEIDKYNIDKKIRQLTNNDIKQVSISLLNKCFYSSSSSSSIQPSCPSCSIKQVKLINQWRFTSLILTSICLLFVLVILLLYTLHIRHIRRSYESIS